MSDSFPASVPRWIDPTLAGSAFVAFVFGAVYCSLELAGVQLLPPPVPSILFLTIVGLLLAQVIYRFDRRHGARLEAMDARSARRYDALDRGLAARGVQLEAITGEIPRIRPLVTACRHGDDLDGYSKGYADGLARVPMAVDAKVINLPRN